MIQSSPEPGALPGQSSLPLQIGRIRAASITTANKILSYDGPPGMWSATGTAIAHAPNLTDLRKNNIDFDVNGHLATRLESSEPEDNKRASAIPTIPPTPSTTKSSNADNKSLNPLVQTLSHSTTNSETPKTWKQIIVTGFVAFWRFFKTPMGLHPVDHLRSLLAPCLIASLHEHPEHAEKM